MCRSDARWRGDPLVIAQPAQPLPNLFPTSEALRRMALPDLPDLFAARAYIGVERWTTAHHPYVRKQVGQVGQVGQRQQRRGFPLPNLVACRLGRSGNGGGQGGQAGLHRPEREPERVLPRLRGCGSIGAQSRGSSMVCALVKWVAMGEIARFGVNYGR